MADDRGLDEESQRHGEHNQGNQGIREDPRERQRRERAQAEKNQHVEIGEEIPAENEQTEEKQGNHRLELAQRVAERPSPRESLQRALETVRRVDETPHVVADFPRERPRVLFSAANRGIARLPRIPAGILHRGRGGGG